LLPKMLLLGMGSECYAIKYTSLLRHLLRHPIFYG
jgi:hypothetical protein